MFLLVPLVATGLICLVAINCGGSGNSGGSSGGGPYDVVGNWTITLNYSTGGSSVGYGTIDSSGRALFFGTTLAGDYGQTLELPTITGASSFSGDMTSYAELGTGGGQVTVSCQGKVNSAASITGTFSGGSSGTFSLSPYAPLSGAATAFTDIRAGYIVSTGMNLYYFTFSKSGTHQSMSFTASNPWSCAFSGTFTQKGTENVFDVSITFTGSACPDDGTVSGLGFESNSDYFNLNGSGQGTYLYADLLGANAFVIEIYP